MVNQVQKLLIKSLLISLALFAFNDFCSLGALAQEPLTITVDTQEVALNQTVNVDIVIKNSTIKNFQFPANTQDYQSLATSSRNNIEIINGQIKQQKTMSYVIKPIRIGQITIPAITYSFNNQIYQTKPIAITVTKPIQQRINTQALERNNPFLEINSSTTNPYVNEQFVIKSRLFHRGNVRNVSYQLLSADHLVLKKIDKANEYKEYRNNVEYMVYEITYIATALKSGAIVIPEYSMQTVIEIEKKLNGQRIDPFNLINALFEEKELEISAKPLSINVKPLPPQSFTQYSGYVGSLNISHQINKLTVNSGEAVTIKSIINGVGNYNSLSHDFFEKSQNYSVYKDKEDLTTKIINNRESFELVTNTVIIPEKRSGRITIKTIPVISFDPSKKQYIENGKEVFEIFVKASDSNVDIDTNNGQHLQAIKPIKAKKSFKKELLIYSIPEIFKYKSWKDNKTSYLLAILIFLNLLYVLRFTLRRVDFESFEEKFDANKLIQIIKKANDLKIVSAIIKDALKVTNNEELKNKILDFTKETDKYNYSFSSKLEDSQLSEFKNRAIQILKELKNVSA